jgi:hypothetical protein
MFSFYSSYGLFFLFCTGCLETCSGFRIDFLIQSKWAFFRACKDDHSHCPSSNRDAWTYIRSIYNFDYENVQSLIEYVEINWISDSRPLFSREVWSHHGTLRGRTNNAAEGFHSKLNKLINKNNSSFLEILYTLKDIQI